MFGLIVVGAIATSNRPQGLDGQATHDATVTHTAVATSPPRDATCKEDWHKCTDNADLINNSGKQISMAYACRDEANKQAKYGDPTWPWAFLMFGTFHKGDNYPKTGIVTLIEHDARFQNGFGAMAHVNVTCTYDLNAKTVTNVVVVDQ
jgi:hypothetical protein